MRKYIEPSIDIMEMDTDSEMLSSSPNDIETYKLNNLVGDEAEYSKHIDFSDSESIW